MTEHQPYLQMSDVEQIVARVRYLDWTLQVVPIDSQAFGVRVSFQADGQQHHGRKWLVSPWSTPSEIVQTCLKAVLTAIEHEAREKFLYRGEAIFGPHFDVDALLCLALDKQLDKRLPPPKPQGDQ